MLSFYGKEQLGDYYKHLFLCSVEVIQVHTHHESEQNWESTGFSLFFFFLLLLDVCSPNRPFMFKQTRVAGLAALFHGTHRGYAVVETSKTSTNHVLSPVSSVWIKTRSKNISEIKVSRQA